ncbi:MAG: cysteine desulfurase [Bacilli bacterium]|nr:cysteine desulfurase [Bacilli bacterium]
MNSEDFDMIQSGVIYFDNGATTLKPRVLAESISDYYNHYSSNAHRGDYEVSIKASSEYENTRELVRELINSKGSNQISFTSGTTDSINKIVFGFFKNYLKKGDEVLLTKSEHASNVLPWFELADAIGIKVNYIELDHNHKVTMENVKKAITAHTKVISLAHISNVVGDVRPIKEITEYAHSKGILVLCDGAQSVPHMKVDVQDLDVDFLTFSAHKMCGPTGVGVIYIKENHLDNIKPIIFGGGMNAEFDNNGTRIYKSMPDLLEAGTPNIAGVIGFGYVIKYLNKIGLDKIHDYELTLKEYLITKLKENPNIEIYNENSESGIVTINYKDIFPQDLSIYLDKYHICTRAGSHCAKILKDELKIKNTCRISLYFYNTKEEIDKLVDALNNPNIKTEII